MSVIIEREPVSSPTLFRFPRASISGFPPISRLGADAVLVGRVGPDRLRHAIAGSSNNRTIRDKRQPRSRYVTEAVGGKHKHFRVLTGRHGFKLLYQRVANGNLNSTLIGFE
ncbi:MAG: hypothetical protein ACJ8AI_07000 [Rhodopila sp.]